MQAVQINVDNSDLTPRDSVITVFNPCPFPRDGVVSCFIDMPDKMDYEAFSVSTPDGKKKQRLQLSEESEPGVLVRNLQDISIELRTRRVRAHVEIGEVPAYGYRTYHLVREPRFAYIPGTLAPEINVLENEHLRAEFNSDGTINLIHKESGRRFDSIHYIEDTGESGHTWIHMEPDRNAAITSHGCPVAIALEAAGPLLARMRVEYRMQIPVGIEPEMTGEYREAVMNHVRRTDATKEITVVSRFTLRAGSRRLDVTTELNNVCKHHRMRVVFPTHLAAETTHSDAAFDVIERDIHVKPGTAYYGKPNPQYPMNRFVDISENKRAKRFGLAVLNRTGMREYEVPDTDDRPLAITLFRAFTYRNCPIFGRYEVYPEMEMAQCPGRMEWTYSLYPHTGDWTNGVYREAEDHNLPLEPAQVGPHAGTLPKQMSFMQVTGGQIQLTAFKRAEDRPGSFVVRLFNPTEKAVSAAINLWKPVKKAWLTNLNEERQKEIKPAGKNINLKFGKKQILTVEFVI
jgi:alpha-mannosidase